MSAYQKWMSVAATIAKSAPDIPVLPCPTCGRTDIEYQYVGDPATRVGYFNVWSAGCLTGIRISRVNVPLNVDMLPFQTPPDIVRARIPNFHDVHD